VKIIVYSKILNFGGLLNGDGNMDRYYLSKLYYPKVRRITSKSLVKIGSYIAKVDRTQLIPRKKCTVCKVIAYG